MPDGFSASLFALALFLTMHGRAEASESQGPAADAAMDHYDQTAAAHVSDGPAPKPPTPSSLRIGLATTAAVVPGLLVHGTGAFALGDTRTGLRLLKWEGAGLGMFLAGGLGLVFTGASRKTVVPFSLLTMQGLGLFTVS